MVTLQGWADASRAAVDPLWLIAGGLSVVLLVLYLLNRPPGERDRAPPGGHYLGKIDKKSLPKMLVLPDRKKKHRSREQMENAIREAGARRRELEARAEALGITVDELLEREPEPDARRKKRHKS